MNSFPNDETLLIIVASFVTMLVLSAVHVYGVNLIHWLMGWIQKDAEKSKPKRKNDNLAPQTERLFKRDGTSLPVSLRLLTEAEVEPHFYGIHEYSTGNEVEQAMAKWFIEQQGLREEYAERAKELMRAYHETYG